MHERTVITSTSTSDMDVFGYHFTHVSSQSVEYLPLIWELHYALFKSGIFIVVRELFWCGVFVHESIPLSKDELPSASATEELVAPEQTKLTEKVTCTPLQPLYCVDQAFNSALRSDKPVNSQKTTFHSAKQSRHLLPSAVESQVQVGVDSGLGGSQPVGSTTNSSVQTNTFTETLSSKVDVTALSTPTPKHTQDVSSISRFFKPDDITVIEEEGNVPRERTAEQRSLGGVEHEVFSTYSVEETPVVVDQGGVRVNMRSLESKVDLFSTDKHELECCSSPLSTKGVMIGNEVIPVFDQFTTSFRESVTHHWLGQEDEGDILPDQVTSIDEGKLLLPMDPVPLYMRKKGAVFSEGPIVPSTHRVPGEEKSDYTLEVRPIKHLLEGTFSLTTQPKLTHQEDSEVKHASTTSRDGLRSLQSMSSRYTIVEGGRKLGYIAYSSSELISQGSYLPLPSQAALDNGIGQGGNGTITNIYHRGREFAVKRTHYRQIEVDVMASLRSEFILSLEAVMMGEEDPARPHRYYCYHFYPRMSGDVQSYLTRLGQGALSNVLMKHKDSPSMLQLVVDNVKHILGCVLRGVEYLHGNNIVHNDIKPSNFLVSLQCECDSPITCKHSQRFVVKIGDFDSAMPVAKLQKSSSLVRQLYRTHPIGTPGYRPVEYVLAGTRSRDELRSDVVTSGDMWSFGCSVLKMFLSHSGPSSQREMSFLHLWGTGCHPWSAEEKRAKEILKVELLQRVYPNWNQLVEFVEDCMKVIPIERARASELLQHQFFSS